jgi:hypothetical protein
VSSGNAARDNYRLIARIAKDHWLYWLFASAIAEKSAAGALAHGRRCFLEKIEANTRSLHQNGRPFILPRMPDKAFSGTLVRHTIHSFQAKLRVVSLVYASDVCGRNRQPFNVARNGMSDALKSDRRTL